MKFYDFKDIDLLKLWETFKDMCIQEVDFMHEKINSEIKKIDKDYILKQEDILLIGGENENLEHLI